MPATIRNTSLSGLTRYLILPILILRRSTTSRSLGTLAFEEVRASSAERPYAFTALVLHGLLGSARNWRSFSRTLASYLSNSSPSSDWRMVLVDLRNHGRSAEIEGLSPPHDMANAAKDVADLVNTQGWAWPDVVLGHSMGGKVALQFAESCARGGYGASAELPKQLWVLDSVPGKVNTENSDGEVEKVLQILQSLPASIPSRRETDYWPLLEHSPKDMEISVVRAEKSDRWDTDAIQRLERVANRKVEESEGKFSVHVLPKSSHWVHVDNPKGLVEILAPRIASIA